MIVPYLTQSNSTYFSKDCTGLGNALFQIFSAYGISNRLNHTFNNYYLIELINKLNDLDLNHSSTIFRNLKTYKTIYKNEIIINERKNYPELYDNLLIEKIKNFNNDTMIIVKGYLQSHLYFDEYYNDIIKLISPDENSLDDIKKRYNHLFDDNIINISLHFRLKYGGNLPYNYEYYYEAIKYIENILNKRKINKKIIINIFGDDIKQIKDRFKNTGYKYIYFEGNYDYIDLWCMSLCSINIISHSTLSWWGAYLNNSKDKLVIYSKDFLRLNETIVYNKPVLTDRIFQHYKTEWTPLDTGNIIFNSIKYPTIINKDPLMRLEILGGKISLKCIYFSIFIILIYIFYIL